MIKDIDFYSFLSLQFPFDIWTKRIGHNPFYLVGICNFFVSPIGSSWLICCQLLVHFVLACHPTLLRGAVVVLAPWQRLRCWSRLPRWWGWMPAMTQVFCKMIRINECPCPLSWATPTEQPSDIFIRHLRSIRSRGGHAAMTNTVTYLSNQILWREKNRFFPAQRRPRLLTVPTSAAAVDRKPDTHGMRPAKACAHRNDVCTKTLLGGADEISTQWCIDPACSLIDAVFKNSLVWGGVELSGKRALLLGTFVYVNWSGGVYSAAAGEAWPPSPWWVTASTPPPDAEVRAEANIHCVLMHLHVCAWLLLMFLFWSISLVFRWLYCRPAPVSLGPTSFIWTYIFFI